MGNLSDLQTVTIRVFVRHKADCKHRNNTQSRQCKCRKSLTIYQNGKTTMVSCKTRSWARAEELAEEERAKYDPAKLRLAEIERAAEKLSEPYRRVSITDAYAQFVTSRKIKNPGTLDTYKAVGKKLEAWALEQGICWLNDITPVMLDQWRGRWGKDALLKMDRMSQAYQQKVQDKIKWFLLWAEGVSLLKKAPIVVFRRITTDHEPTQPLNSEQFEELLAATALYTYRPSPQNRLCRDTASSPIELRTLFLLMRFSGLRIGDALMLSRDSLKGNFLRLRTIKTDALYEGTLTDIALDALLSLPRREGVHPDYFFWSGKVAHTTIKDNWVRAIKRFNRHLSFHDEDGKPMHFHSHMLRDTFAVEMLLAGVPLEVVSKLLTHANVGITDKHYNPYVKRRREQLQQKMVESMRQQGFAVTDR